MCLNPLEILNPRLIKAEISLVESGVNPYEWLQAEKKYINVPCGKCVECLEQRSRDWAFRCNEEAKHHKDNCCITLTYANTDGELNKRDYQLFLKRLRKLVAPKKIRVFGCGEYGSKGMRPHYHIILFGYKFDDIYYWKRSKKSGDILYRSPTLEKVWTLGYSTVEQFNSTSAKYMSLYFQKLNDFDCKKQRPFIICSLRPGIGYKSINSSLIETDKLYDNGKYIKLPRYFIKVLEQRNENLENLKENRIQKALMYEETKKNTLELLKKERRLNKYFAKKSVLRKPILTSSEKFLKNFVKNLKNT